MVFSIRNNRSCAKQSGINVIVFPEIGSSGLSVETMLSARAFDFVPIWVSDVIWGNKDDEYTWLRNWAVLVSVVYRKRSTLKLVWCVCSSRVGGFQ